MTTVNGVVAKVSAVVKDYRKSNLFLGILQSFLSGTALLRAYVLGTEANGPTYVKFLTGASGR